MGGVRVCGQAQNYGVIDPCIDQEKATTKEVAMEVADSELPAWFQSVQQEMKSKHWSEFIE